MVDDLLCCQEGINTKARFYYKEALKGIFVILPKTQQEFSYFGGIGEGNYNVIEGLNSFPSYLDNPSITFDTINNLWWNLRKIERINSFFWTITIFKLNNNNIIPPFIDTPEFKGYSTDGLQFRIIANTSHGTIPPTIKVIPSSVVIPWEFFDVGLDNIVLPPDILQDFSVVVLWPSQLQTCLGVKKQIINGIYCLKIFKILNIDLFFSVGLPLKKITDAIAQKLGISSTLIEVEANNLLIPITQQLQTICSPAGIEAYPEYKMVCCPDGKCPPPDKCPPNTCQVECGDHVCCYSSQGKVIFSFVKSF